MIRATPRCRRESTSRSSVASRPTTFRSETVFPKEDPTSPSGCQGDVAIPKTPSCSRTISSAANNRGMSRSRLRGSTTSFAHSSRASCRKADRSLSSTLASVSGLFDDWLCHAVGATAAASSVTSVDRDPAICRVFALRQRRERHPFPARVICGDVRDRRPRHRAVRLDHGRRLDPRGERRSRRDDARAPASPGAARRDPRRRGWPGRGERSRAYVRGCLARVLDAQPRR